MAPRISVVLPSFNHAAYVERALRSALEQDVDDLELVVVDDGSTDGSREVIRDVLADARGRRTTYHEQENSGSHAAIARGLELASGPIVALLNSDDEYAPGRLRRALEHVPPSGDFLLFTGLQLVDGAGRALAPPSRRSTPWLPARAAGRGSSPTSCARAGASTRASWPS